MALFITHDMPGPQWQLALPSSGLGTFALTGWNSDDPDGGVPGQVVEVLARSLSRFGRATFPCARASATDSPGWQRQDSDFVARYRIGSILGRVPARLAARGPVDLALLSTTSEQAIRGLFDDPDYPWWNQAQFVLMSPADAPPPDFDRIAFDPAMLFERDWSEEFARSQPLGVQAILRPGVDGDVAGLLYASPAIRDRFEAILSACADESGTSLKHVSEAEFIAALAASPAGR